MNVCTAAIVCHWLHLWLSEPLSQVTFCPLKAARLWVHCCHLVVSKKGKVLLGRETQITATKGNRMPLYLTYYFYYVIVPSFSAWNYMNVHSAHHAIIMFLRLVKVYAIFSLHSNFHAPRHDLALQHMGNYSCYFAIIVYSCVMEPLPMWWDKY